MPNQSAKKASRVTVQEKPRTPSLDSSDASAITSKAPSLKSPRTPRFAEATAVNSPIEPSKTGRSPFSGPPLPSTNHYMAQPQISDVGFGYVNKHESVEMPNTDDYEYPSVSAKPSMTAMKSPLKSAMKTPGAAPRDLGAAILSPTFREEQILEKREKATEKQQARDVRIKTRVRMAKFGLRGVNFACSLVVLSMLSTTFSIFNASKDIPKRNNLPPWAENQKIWPQVTLLCISCVSMAVAILVFYGYYKGGHRRASKYSTWYTWFAVAWFTFSIIMWAIGAGILHGSKANGDKKDMWGWACNDNTRKQLFQNQVNYALVCELQNWSLLCAIIEIVVEVITMVIYGVIFYRFYSKRELRKSMAKRDKARSDLYLAQLRAQSQPNTPFTAAPYSARDGGWRPPVDYYNNAPTVEEGVQYASMDSKPQPSAFKLQPPPLKGATPKMQQVGFTPIHTTSDEGQPEAYAPTTQMQQEQASPLLEEMPAETYRGHVDAAPGEQVYDSVPIPGAYEPLSPGAGPEGRPMHFPS